MTRRFKVFKSLNSIEELHNEYQSLIKGICDNLGIEFIDSNKHFEKSVKKKDWCFIDRAHLTDIGSQHVSNLLRRLLEKN